MMWNEYPWSNVHELNLNWIIKQVFDYGKSIDEFKEELIEAVNLFNSLRDNINNLQSSVQTINEEINNINGEVDFINNNIDTITSNVDNLTTDLNTLTASVSRIEIDLTYLADKVDNIESTIQVIAEQVLREFIESGQLQLRLSEQYDALEKSLTLYISGGSD